MPATTASDLPLLLEESDMAMPQKGSIASSKCATENGVAAHQQETQQQNKKNKKKSKRTNKTSSRSNTSLQKQTKKYENKPLIDLRSILQKHEKKVEKPADQEYEEVGFYGSMTPSQFLLYQKPTHLSSTTASPTKKRRSIRTLTSSEEEPPSAKEENESTTILTIEDKIANKKREQPRFTIIKDFDEEQLKLWKKMMNADDDVADYRPSEMLPLRPSAFSPMTRKSKRVVVPSQHRERAFGRPDDWVGPESKLHVDSRISYTADCSEDL